MEEGKGLGMVETSWQAETSELEGKKKHYKRMEM
jgi:hypothetical protein